MLIIERNRAEIEFGHQRDHQLLPNDTVITADLLENAEAIILINPLFRQLSEIRQTHFRVKDIYIALDESASEDISDCIEKYRFGLLHFLSGNEEHIINSVMSLLRANIGFGADIQDFRKMIENAREVQYRYIIKPDLDEYFSNLKYSSKVSSVLATLSYDLTYSFVSIDRLSMRLKQYFSTENVVFVFSESCGMPTSLGLFIAFV